MSANCSDSCGMCGAPLGGSNASLAEHLELCVMLTTPPPEGHSEYLARCDAAFAKHYRPESANELFGARP